jgi:hypothetical protein
MTALSLKKSIIIAIVAIFSHLSQFGFGMVK